MAVFEFVDETADFHVVRRDCIAVEQQNGRLRSASVEIMKGERRVSGGRRICSNMKSRFFGGRTQSSAKASLSILTSSVQFRSASIITGITVRVGHKWPLRIGPLITGLGFTLFQWIDPATSYVRGVLPGVLLIALGMAGVVAPLTTAVLSSVDDRHMGTASGFNSAIARTGGLIATALAGLVISREGADLLTAFRAAALAGAGLAFASGLISFLTLREFPQINSSISPH